MRFKNKTVVITGAAKGIGAETANWFLKESARVAILDIEQPCEDALKQFNGHALAIKCDVSKRAEVENSIRKVIQTFADINILINNAGIQHYGTVTETTEEDWDRVLAVNLKSAFLCAQNCIPSMQKIGKGVIVNIASIQSFHTQTQVAPYTTSKTALLGLTRSIAVDYAPKIRCVAVCPGTVDTPMLRWAIQQSPNPQQVLDECIQMHPVGRIATPQEVASLILYLCSDDASFITGQYFRIDGGLGLSLGGSKKS